MEIVVVVICERNGFIVEFLREVPVAITDADNPSYTELFEQIRHLFPNILSSDFCLYYRIANDKFVPIYDYLTLMSALTTMAKNKIYMLKKSALENWEPMQHPVYLLRGNPCDIELIRQVIPNVEISPAQLGFTVSEDNARKKVLDLLKGVPMKRSPPTVDKKKSPKDKLKSKEYVAKKNLKTKSVSETGKKKKLAEEKNAKHVT